MACTNKTVVILWLNQFHLTGCSDHLRGRGIFINRLCLTDLPSMGKNCWFIFIHPFWECVCKWVGLGYILAFLLSKAHCLAFGPIWSKLCPSLNSFCSGTPNNSFCSNVRPNRSNSGPALSSNPTLTKKLSSFKFHRIFIHSHGVLNECTPATRNTLVKCSR